MFFSTLSAHYLGTSSLRGDWKRRTKSGNSCNFLLH